MGTHPDDVTAAPDFSLVRAARHGDRLAFGVLYLRHHAAAWRIACVASRFSPDAELAVIEGFTRLFSALPEEAEEFRTGAVTLRPYVLACTRQAALERAGAAGRADGAGAGAPAPLAGLGPDGEVVLSSLEHHVARGALAALPERSRTALWLFDVEAMTPAEVAGILDGDPQEVAALAESARAEVRSAQQTAFGRHEVRAGCRFTVEQLDAYRAGALEPTDGLIVRSHLDRCLPCRMRHGELADAPATLAAAVPAAPLLGGETQQHWLVSAPGLRPADRLLAPGLAAAGPAAAGAARRIPDVLRRAGRAAARSWRPADEPIDLTAAASAAGPAGAPEPAGADGWTDALRWSGSFAPLVPPAWTLPPALAAAGAGPDAPAPVAAEPGRARPTAAGGAPDGSRRSRRAAAPALTAVSLVAAWIVVMVGVPWLMTPGTSPGPDGLALPAVQAYVNGLLPDAAPTRSGAAPRSEPFLPGGSPAVLRSSPSAPEPASGAGSGGPSAAADGTLRVSAAHSSRSGNLDRTGVTTTDVSAVVAPAIVPVSVAVAAPAVPAPPAAGSPAPAGGAPAGPSTGPDAGSRPGKPVHPGKPGKKPGPVQLAATVPDQPQPTTGPASARRPGRRHPGRQGRIITA